MAPDDGERSSTEELVAGVDIGNSTTEASLARVAPDGTVRFVGGSLTPTTGVKGTVGNVEGVVRVLRAALQEARLPASALSRVLLNEATPVISGLAMETITETVITESTMIGHDPRTPGGVGTGVGTTTALADLDVTGTDADVVVVVPRGNDFEDTARRIQRALDRGVPVVAAVLGSDDAVLVVNRVDRVLPVVDEVTRVEDVPLGMLAAVEVAEPGRTIRTLSNAYGLATIFGLDADETRAVSPVARALTGNRSAVVVRTPAGDVTDRTLPAGQLLLAGESGRSLQVDVSEGAEAIMATLARAQPLADATGEPGTNVGGMMAGVRESMADLAGLDVGDVHVRDLLAVDTFAPLEVRGGLAGEVALENAVALAAMVRTSHSSMRQVAEAVTTQLRRAGADAVSSEVGGVEAEMAVLGALTTPGTDRPLVVLDLGGGSTDAAVAEPGGGVRTTHLAGAGDLVTRLIAAELGLDEDVAEQVKRHPLAKVESFFHARLENGTTRFYDEPLPPATFARLVTLGDSMAPLATRHSLDRVREVRREAKRRVFVVNALRALTVVAPHGDLRQIGFVVLLGGCALDFEIPEMVADALAPYGIVCGTGNVRGTEGPRNAVASGLVAADAAARRTTVRPAGA